METIDIKKIQPKRFEDIKKQSKDDAFMLMRSIKLYGQTRNVVVDHEYNLIEGSKIYKTMLDDGYELIKVKIVDNPTIEEALEMNMNLNGAFGEVDYVKLSIVAKRLYPRKNIEELTATLPFQKNDIQDFVDMIDFDFDKYKDQPPAQLDMFGGGEDAIG